MDTFLTDFLKPQILGTMSWEQERKGIFLLAHSSLPSFAEQCLPCGALNPSHLWVVLSGFLESIRTFLSSIPGYSPEHLSSGLFLLGLDSVFGCITFKTTWVYSAVRVPHLWLAGRCLKDHFQNGPPKLTTAVSFVLCVHQALGPLEREIHISL